jgi:hypothetical protein
MTFSSLGLRHSVRQFGWTVWVGAALLILGSASLASADAVPPDVMVCDRQPVGAACFSDGVAGECAASRCTRLDYASWDRDASMTPPSVEYDCIRCNNGISHGDDAGPHPGSPGHCSASHGSAGAGWILAMASALLVVVRRARR